MRNVNKVRKGEKSTPSSCFILTMRNVNLIYSCLKRCFYCCFILTMRNVNTGSITSIPRYSSVLY